MRAKPFKFLIFLSFIMLMGQESCQTTPTGRGQNGGIFSSGRQTKSNLPGDQGPFGSVTCESPQNTFQCMMCNCFLEAGNQGYEGRVAVNKVVMTRVGMPDYPNTVCGVIY